MLRLANSLCNSQSCINDSSLEMLCSIATLLDAGDFFSFRLSSWLIHNSTIPQFRHTMLQTPLCLSAAAQSGSSYQYCALLFGPTVHTLVAHIIGAPDISGPDEALHIARTKTVGRDYFG